MMIHTLCEQSKWDELSYILNSMLDAATDNNNNNNNSTSSPPPSTSTSSCCVIGKKPSLTTTAVPTTTSETTCSHKCCDTTAPPSSSAYNDESPFDDDEEDDDDDDEGGTSSSHRNLYVAHHYNDTLHANNNTTTSTTASQQPLDNNKKTNNNSSNNSSNDNDSGIQQHSSSSVLPLDSTSINSFDTNLKCSYEKLYDHHDDHHQDDDQDDSLLLAAAGDDEKTPDNNNKQQRRRKDDDDDYDMNQPLLWPSNDGNNSTVSNSSNKKDETDLKNEEGILMMMTTNEGQRTFLSTTNNNNKNNNNKPIGGGGGSIATFSFVASSEEEEGEASSTGAASTTSHDDNGHNNNKNNNPKYYHSINNASSTTQTISLSHMSSYKAQLTQRKGTNKLTPLSICIIKCAPPSIISTLLQLCSSSLSSHDEKEEVTKIPDKDGSLPLHLICSRLNNLMLNNSSIMKKKNEGSEEYDDDEEEELQQQQQQQQQQQLQQMMEEVHQIIQLLLSSQSSPGTLATVNRWEQTPLHVLFCQKEVVNNNNRRDGVVIQQRRWTTKKKRRKMIDNGLLLCIVKTLLGQQQQQWDDDDPTTSSIQQQQQQQMIQSAAIRSIKHYDIHGKLPLHHVSECCWLDEKNEDVLRTIINVCPMTVCFPVFPPPPTTTIAAGENNESEEEGSGSIGSSINGGDGAALYEWDVNRDAVIPLEDDDDDKKVVVFPKKIVGGGGCYGKDLAVHLLHKRLVSTTSSPAPSSMCDSDDEVSGYYSTDTSNVSVLLNDKSHCCGLISALLEPLVDAAARGGNSLEGARLACAATGSFESASTTTTMNKKKSKRSGNNKKTTPSRTCTNTTLLPIHIAAIHGVSFNILQGLCRAYPEGAATPLNSPTLHPNRINTLPIELFEEGIAGQEVNEASDSEFPSLSIEYFQRSDLLFSYHPGAVSSKGIAYCQDIARLLRFEKLIRREATSVESDGILSDMAGSVWLFICRSSDNKISIKSQRRRRRGGRRSTNNNNNNNNAVNFNAVIGRILEGLEPHSIVRLNFIRTKSIPEGIRVPQLANGRTILEEAKERSPNGSMSNMLAEHFFHSSVLSFLNAKDALSYSAVCRKAWTRGVRLLRCIPNKFDTMDTHGKFKLSSNEKQMWQTLILPFAPSCTHTVFITCNVSYESWRDEDSTCKGGGLFVMSKDDDHTSKSAVSSSTPVRANGKSTTSIRLSFNHSSGQSYDLGYYGSERHTLTISNLVIRQLVYSIDSNGLNPLHVLLYEGGGGNSSNIREQLDALIAAGFGSNLPIHYALKVGVSPKMLHSLIETNPAALLDIDSEKRTPLHAALDSPRMPPSIDIVQALLTSPGVNATHLKDSCGRLPIHLAAEHGAGEAILRVLVDAYADGCYRRTDGGDLPLHLLVRSGSATQETVELLLRPIIHNPTICSYPGSIGVNLPLHIAAEYQCQYSILEALLSSYSEAAETKRQLMQQTDSSKSEGEKQKKNAVYALEIFEEGRPPSMIAKTSDNKKAAKVEDFNHRSDLIFVHNPDVPKSSRPYMTTYYRDEKARLERLATIIKEEAVKCSIKQLNREEEEGAELSEMVTLAWCWMASNERYADVVKEIAKAVPIETVRFLALVKNKKSEPVADTPMKDCAAPRCALIIQSRLSFLGRYVLDRSSSILHKSESGVVLLAKDIGAMEPFLSIQMLLDAEEPDIDDYSHACGSVYAITGNTIEIDRFTHFASKLGLDQSEAIAELEKLMEEDGTNLKECGVKKSIFREFCKLYSVDDEGCRSVVIKFISRKQSFELEKQCRGILSESGKEFNIVPIINDFSFEGDSKGNSNDFIKDIYEGGPPLLNIDLSGFKYGLVLPAANGDLRDIFYRQGMSSSNIRGNIRQVGETLQALHEQGISYMNLQLKNVLQFGNKMVLSDFGNALFLKSIGGGINAIGGSAQRSISTSILPPEMMTKFDLSNRDSFDQVMRYWKYVHPDANYLRALTPHERDAISQFIESGVVEGWKSSISSLLETIKFDDLPPALSQCTSFSQFRSTWERMLENYKLWEIVRPRLDEANNCVYMLKSFENRDSSPPRDISILPYHLVPSEQAVKADVWCFGMFIYELCSGGNPFHTGMLGDLRGVESYSKLYKWSRSDAEKSVREHVQDPLARHLLCQILVPEEERLSTISAVLEHPFFSPKSVEAERFLEKDEEMQLLRDNTVTVRKVTKAVSILFDDSMEKYCKLAFATDEIAFPCCLMMLPYELNIDESVNNKPIADASKNSDVLACAERLGKCLLEINKSTARLSFWLMMSGKMRGSCGDEFKAQMQEWLKRSRHESCSSIASELVASLGCDPGYAKICEEVLASDGTVSKAKSYMRDPVRAARREIKRNSEEMSNLYHSLRYKSYIYLIDEATMIPNCSPTKGLVKSPRSLYPIQLESSSKLIVNVILPFMNIVVMKALARSGFEGLADILGLPPSLGIPECWKSSDPGLLHRMDNSASIEEFVSLQRILRENDLKEFRDDASLALSKSYHSGVSSNFDNMSFLSVSALQMTNMDTSSVDPAIAGIPMTQLELLFREKEPERVFGGLKRVTSADANHGLWTSVEAVTKLKSMVEVAELEEKLRDLKFNIDQTKAAAVEYASLSSKRELLKRSVPNDATSPLGQAFLFDNSFDQSSLPTAGHSEQDVGKVEEEQQDERGQSGTLGIIPETKLEPAPEPKHEISTQTSMQYPPTSSNPKVSSSYLATNSFTDDSPKSNNDPEDEAGQKKKMRKSKRRFRPWFTAC